MIVFLQHYTYVACTSSVLCCGQVDEAKGTLDAWKRQVEEWHNEYPHLLFFSVPKLLRLHENLFSAPQPDEISIASGVTFFFNSSEAARSQLKSSVKVYAYIVGHNIMHVLSKQKLGWVVGLHIVCRAKLVLFSNTLFFPYRKYFHSNCLDLPCQCQWWGSS